MLNKARVYYSEGENPLRNDFMIYFLSLVVLFYIETSFLKIIISSVGIKFASYLLQAKYFYQINGVKKLYLD